ncbi:alpha,alpha-trehalose-phosphate synthase (UDP-forming) [Pseudoroseicyclus tamaricis]|uniref:Trehalose-6-phosphate synthase n=1 Tax=Pseudoroseicyclus tamaricis TaxID=2705421 RepID=A0A6B2JP08_9RHOB|nr:trehalose-6-phosphate synthase [Pseudoroseicyclus tamaricis]NDV00437.1 trehalose-6-phosphate synthase [Pseudoroseicyclus tamaricis]
MTGRLIVVSNRIPMGDVPSGGLVVAIHEALSERGGLWIGAHPDVVDEATEEFADLPSNGYEKKAFRITEEDHQTHYLGYANSVLWPLCHHRADLLAMEPSYFPGYVALNERVARMIARIAEPEDMIWVQDYHFLPLAQALRKEGVTGRIGLFLHIPFPHAGDLDALSERELFLDWFAAFDMVGLQTQADVARCLETFRSAGKGEMMLDGRLKVGKRKFDVLSLPIGIDAERFAEMATEHDGRSLLNLSPREDIIIGVDRLDYSKGLPGRFRGFGRFLDMSEEGDRRVSLLQIAPPTREDVAAYAEIRDELESLSGKINGAHTELDWTPIRYIHRPVPRDTLAALYRVSRIGLVTPLADGMNLVAKEYVAAQDPEDPGVLVLSRTAGAAEQMEEALLINPYDADDIARAIARGLAMPLEERRERHKALLEGVMRDNVSAWCEACLGWLERPRRPTHEDAQQSQAQETT